jgi:hypothetical protein
VQEYVSHRLTQLTPIKTAHISQFTMRETWCGRHIGKATASLSGSHQEDEQNRSFRELLSRMFPLLTCLGIFGPSKACETAAIGPEREPCPSDGSPKNRSGRLTPMTAHDTQQRSTTCQGPHRNEIEQLAILATLEAPPHTRWQVETTSKHRKSPDQAHRGSNMANHEHRQDIKIEQAFFDRYFGDKASRSPQQGIHWTRSGSGEPAHLGRDL